MWVPSSEDSGWRKKGKVGTKIEHEEKKKKKKEEEEEEKTLFFFNKLVLDFN